MRSASRSLPADEYVCEARGIEQAIASHAASNVDNRSGRRSASADCNKSNIDAGVNRPARSMSACQRSTSRAASRQSSGTLSRAESASARPTRERGSARRRDAAKSCTRTAYRAGSESSCTAAQSMARARWIPASICRRAESTILAPNSRSISGKSCASARCRRCGLGCAGNGAGMNRGHNAECVAQSDGRRICL